MKQFFLMKRRVFLVVVMAIFALAGCTFNHEITHLGDRFVMTKDMHIDNKVPIKAAILIPKEERNKIYQFTNRIDFTGETHIYPVIVHVGDILIKSAIQTFGEFLEEPVLVEEMPSSDFDVIIQPTIEDYNFFGRFSHEPYKYTVQATGRAIAKVVLYSADGKEIYRDKKTIEPNTSSTKEFMSIGQISIGMNNGTVPMIVDSIQELAERMFASKKVQTFFASIEKGEYKANHVVDAGQRPSLASAQLLNKQLPLLRKDTHAIVIGIDYKGREDVPGLKYPSQDAKKVYDVLTDARYGGVPKENATLLLNEKATLTGIKSALRKIKNSNGYMYVYYSGHGAPKAQGDRMTDAFIVPYDADISSPDAMDDTAIKISEIEKLMEESKAKGVMVALDACFTGSGKSVLPSGGKPVMLDTKDFWGLRGQGKVILTSSASNQQSWEDDRELKSGIFSYYFIEGLKGKAATKDEWVKVADLSKYVKENVSAASRRLKGEEQTPQVLGEGNFAVARNWDRAKVMDAEIAKQRLKAALEKGEITDEQLNKAMDELKTPNRSKTLESFLGGKIDGKKFGELY